MKKLILLVGVLILIIGNCFSQDYPPLRLKNDVIVYGQLTVNGDSIGAKFINVDSVKIGGQIIKFSTGDTLVDNQWVNDKIVNHEFSYLDFDTTASSVFRTGRLRWNDNDKTLEIDAQIDGTEAVLQIGQEQWIRVINNTGSLINNGSAVYINGSVGDKPSIALANAKYDSTSLTFVGMTTENIQNGSEGFVTTFGNVRELNTNDTTAGTIVYLDTLDGGWTAKRPIAPNNIIAIGIITRSHLVNGMIGVQPRILPNIIKVSDVYVNDLRNNEILKYDSINKRWINDLIVSSPWVDNGYNIEYDKSVNIADSTTIGGPTFVNDTIYSQAQIISPNAIVETGAYRTRTTVNGVYHEIYNGTDWILVMVNKLEE